MVQPLKRLLKSRTKKRHNDCWTLDSIPPLGDMDPQRFGAVMAAQDHVWEIRTALRERDVGLDEAVFRITGDHIPEPVLCRNEAELTAFLEKHFSEWCVDVATHEIHRPPPDRRNAAPPAEFHLKLEKIYDNLDAKPSFSRQLRGTDKPVPQTLRDDVVLILCEPVAKEMGWDRRFPDDLENTRIVVELGEWVEPYLAAHQAEYYYAVLDNEVRNAALTKLGQLIVYVDRWGNGLCTHLYGDVKQRKLSVIERRWHSWAFWGDSEPHPFQALVPPAYGHE